MKILVCGDRNWTKYEVIFRWLKSIQGQMKDPSQLMVINGAAPGADRLSTQACKALGIPVQEFPAKWDQFGKAAGPIRNTEMMQQKPDRVVAFHDDIRKSKGTRNMAMQAMAGKIRVVNVTSNGKGQILPYGFFLLA